MMKESHFFFVFTLLVLQGCAPHRLVNCDDASHAQFKQIEQEQQWWRVFDDPLMNCLAERLLDQNIDIKIAQARLEEAHGLARIVNSGFFPDISIIANTSRGNNQVSFVKPISINQGGFDAEWKIDIFGQTRKELDAAENRIIAHRASVEDVVNSVLAELFCAIIEWKQSNQILKETYKLIISQNEQVRLFSIRVNAGLIDASFLNRAAAQRTQTATGIPLSQANIERSRYKIEQLLGNSSENLSSILNKFSDEFIIPDTKRTIDVTIDVVSNRPDIRAAKAEMIAAQSDLSKAEANTWPQITLGTFFGIQDGSNGTHLASNPIWSIASGIIIPFLNFERLQGAVDTANARAKQSYLAYKKAVLTAMSETKTALSDYLNSVNVFNQQQQTLHYRREAVVLAKNRFERGLTDMVDLTTAQSELDQATVLLIESKALSAIAYIRLQKALGRVFYNPKTPKKK